MSGYAKLFSTIITSSIWSEDDKVRIMWVTMLATADARGYVSGSVPGMAAVARMSVDDARRSIEILCSPDPDSRTKDHEGRRLLPCDGGWLVVNYEKYRNQRDPEIRAKQNREAQQRWRDNHRKQRVSQISQKSAQAEAEAEAEKNISPTPLKKRSGKSKSKTTKRASFTPPTVEQVEAFAAEKGYPDFDGQKFVDYYATADWHDSHDNPVKNWKQKLLAIWLKDGPNGTPKKREPQRGDPDWLPSEEQVLADRQQCEEAPA